MTERENRAGAEDREEKKGQELRAEDQASEASPRKQHGDAMQDGTGTRHGIQGSDERPET
jgi:hypothetical protein